MKVLEVSTTDLQGKRFNGYDLIEKINNHDIKQIVLEKFSSIKESSCLFDCVKDYYIYLKLIEIEKEYSLQSVFSITSQLLLNCDEYNECDKVHIHSLANCKMSLFSLLKISEKKRIIISFNDPWYITGRCVHFYDCKKWKNGCAGCKNLNTSYPMLKDNSSIMWKLKKNIFDNMDFDIVVPSKWMEDLIKESNIFKDKKYNLIPFGIDTDLFKKRSISRKSYGIDSNKIVLFFRAQKDYKGTNYIVDALKEYSNENVTIITCGEKGLLGPLYDRYHVLELGVIDEEELINTYSISDMFLMPSIGETFGLMAIEAMSCECPIIVFKTTALERVTNSPNNGIAVDYCDSNKLLEAIKDLIGNEKKRKELGKSNREFVKLNYDYIKYLSSIDSLYSSNSINKETLNIKGKSDDNLLHFLNIVSKKIFGNNGKIISNLKYNCKEDNSNIDFSDLEVQKTIFDYCKKLYDVSKNYSYKIPVVTRIKFYLKGHRKLYYFVKRFVKDVK